VLESSGAPQQKRDALERVERIRLSGPCCSRACLL
jgi:hypothetical protein